MQPLATVDDLSGPVGVDLTVPRWAWFVVVVAAMVMYLVTLENGALLGDAATTLHEFLHDGRHFVAVPCH